jgi:hypothetical protein
MRTTRPALQFSVALVLGGAALPVYADENSSQRFCNQALTNSLDGAELFTLPGAYSSDGLHGSFAPSVCPQTGFSWSTEAMTAERREALAAYMTRIRGDRMGGWVDYPMTLIGRIEFREEGRRRHMVVSDFLEPQ